MHERIQVSIMTLISAKRSNSIIMKVQDILTVLVASLSKVILIPSARAASAYTEYVLTDRRNICTHSD